MEQVSFRAVFARKRTKRNLLRRGGEDCLGFGFDFDGVDKLPQEINGIENTDLIIKKLSAHFDEPLVRKIASENLINKVSK